MASLGWGLIRREVASGPLRLFVLALALCVASILSVTLVADRLNAALKVSGRDYIAADRMLSGSRPAEASWLAEAQERGCRCRWGNPLTACCLPTSSCSWPAFAPWTMPFLLR
ncbi:hypothetical protein MBH78_11715 [Oceanimonas sp. NS1]|nr:hypothetical protein [Oceanimonas sp. NS1]